MILFTFFLLSWPLDLWRHSESSSDGAQGTSVSSARVSLMVHISWTSPRMKGVLDYCPAWVERWRGTECVQPLSHIVIYWCSLSDLFSSNTAVVRETADVSWFGLISILFWSWYLYNWGHVVLWRVCVTTSKGEGINRMRFHSELIPAKLKFFITPSWDCCI